MPRRPASRYAAASATLAEASVARPGGAPSDHDGSHDDGNDDHAHARPSKSQRKRDMTALQDLGEELVLLKPERLARLDLPDNLRDAVAQARRITSHEGRRRQLQYIGRLMRGVDSTPIAAALAAWRGEAGAETAQLHLLEDWRRRLLADDGALAALCTAHTAALAPDTLQRLRTLVRAARKEQAEARPPRHFRELFQLLKDIVTEDPADAS